MVSNKAKEVLTNKLNKEKADADEFAEQLYYFKQGVCPNCGSQKISHKKFTNSFFSLNIKKKYICNECRFEIDDFENLSYY